MLDGDFISETTHVPRYRNVPKPLLLYYVIGAQKPANTSADQTNEMQIDLGYYPRILVITSCLISKETLIFTVAMHTTSCDKNDSNITLFVALQRQDEVVHERCSFHFRMCRCLYIDVANTPYRTVVQLAARSLSCSFFSRFF